MREAFHAAGEPIRACERCDDGGGAPANIHNSRALRDLSAAGGLVPMQFAASLPLGFNADSQILVARKKGGGEMWLGQAVKHT